MSPQHFDEILSKHRSTKARYAYLRSQMAMLERFLKQCQGDMINDEVSMSQAITGMPHGTTVGDPVSRLAIDIASGKVSVFVKQIQDEIKDIQAEIRKIGPDIRIVEIVLGALNDRERAVLEMKMIDEMSWGEVLMDMNLKYSNSYSKRSLQRLLDRALGKAYEIIK